MSYAADRSTKTAPVISLFSVSLKDLVNPGSLGYRFRSRRVLGCLFGVVHLVAVGERIGLL